MPFCDQRAQSALSPPEPLNVRDLSGRPATHGDVVTCLAQEIGVRPQIGPSGFSISTLGLPVCSGQSSGCIRRGDLSRPNSDATPLMVRRFDVQELPDNGGYADSESVVPAVRVQASEMPRAAVRRDATRATAPISGSPFQAR